LIGFGEVSFQALAGAIGRDEISYDEETSLKEKWDTT